MNRPPRSDQELLPIDEASPAVAGTVAAVRVGPVQRQTWSGRELSTAAAKHEVGGPVRATVAGLAGDDQADREHHGGPDKAVLAYARESYDAWRADGVDLPEGAFFENLTVIGWPEARVHAGDVFAVGTTVLQVTQPRRPCRKLSARWGLKELPVLVQQTGRCGYYLRVLQEGELGAGDAMTLLRRLDRSVSVDEINRVMNVDRSDRDGIARLLASPELPEAWRVALQRRLDGLFEDDGPRLGV